jgi:hypothetical protein
MLDDSYASMMSQVFGVIFLSTPHKGSAFARTLNNILSVSFLSSSKIYVAELETQSPTLQSINEQFRLVCKNLQLVSFYETLKTNIGGTKKLVGKFLIMSSMPSTNWYQIVDRDSGILGYPGESSSSMMADHHNVCKYSSPNDPNFIALRNTIRDWAIRLNPHGELFRLQEFK